MGGVIAELCRRPSNSPFEQWGNFLPDVTAASAILDCVLHQWELVLLEPGDFDRSREG
jgi:hypothetical protein